MASDRRRSTGIIFTITGVLLLIAALIPVLQGKAAAMTYLWSAVPFLILGAGFLWSSRTPPAA